MQLSNTTIYSSSTGLYIASGDHNLIEVMGADVALLEGMLTGLAAADSLDCIYERFRSDCDDDRDYFDELIAWLVEQGIILPKPGPVPPPVATFLHAPYLSEATRLELLTRLSGFGTREYEPVANYQDAHLVLMLAPLFEYQAQLQQLNRYTYQQRIPVCHIGVDTGTFTLGPLVHPAVGTPCLNCYLRRKLSNLKDPQKTLAFIQHPNKRHLTDADPRANPYLNVALTHVAVELDKFFDYDGQISPLLGKSIVFDHLDYGVTKSKILRVPGCDVCNPAPAYSAFNP